MSFKTIIRTALIPVAVALLSACQTTTTPVASTPAVLTPPPAAVDFSAPGETPVDLHALARQVLAENPGRYSMVINQGRKGIAIDYQDVMEVTRRPRGSSAYATSVNPISVSDGKRVCWTIPNRKPGWFGVCAYGYKRPDGTVRVAIAQGNGDGVQELQTDIVGVPRSYKME